MGETTVHSELGASSYKRWKACPGSVRLSRGVERKSSAYADEGTRAHELAEALLCGVRSFDYSNKPGDMVEAVMTYVNYVSQLRAQGPAWEQIEAKLDLAEYHPKLFGTGDYVCYFPSTKILHVVDYKHGAGVPVEIEEDGLGNVQLLYYAAAALHKARVPVRAVVITIVQPRCPHPDGPVRSWSCDGVFMLDFLADLVADAEKTEDPDAPLNPGSHCRWCPAVGFCPAIKSRAVVEAAKVFAPAIPYEPSKLAETLSKLDSIEAWAHGVREFAYREAEAGREIPGWKLVDKRPSRKWAEGVLGSKLAAELGVLEESLFEQKLKSPAQVEKLIDRSRRGVLDEFTVKESSGKKLVPVSDDRPGTNPQIRTVFEVITTEEKGNG
jgi:hypothetical protein